MTPTRWFIAVNDQGAQVAAARWYWPESTLTEVFRASDPQWVEIPVLTDLIEDPSWRLATEEEVEQWAASLPQPSLGA